MNQKDTPWHTLNIDMSDAINLTFEKDQLSRNRDNKDWELEARDSTELTTIFTPEWLEKMASFGLPVSHVLIFYRAPGYLHPTAHIDLATPKNNRPPKSFGFSLNYCIGDDPGAMVWYLPKTDAKVGSAKTTNVGTPYIELDLSQLNEIARHRIGNKLTLVRVDIPHNVELNNSSIPRICLSIRIQTDIMFDKPTWDDLIEYMEPYIDDNN